MKKYIILLFILLMTASVFAQQQRPRLAILPFTGAGGSDGETIAMLLGNQSDLRSAFTTVARTSNVEAIAREQEFQSSGFTDSDTIARLGRQMNADYVVAGHILQLGRSRIVMISIVHVETFQQIAGDYKEYTDITQIRAYLPDMVRRIVTASRQDTSARPRIAVTPFNVLSGRVNERDADVLSQILSIEIANSGRYMVLPRTSTIQSAIAEQLNQRSGITDPDTIRRIGVATNANYVLAGNITSLGQINIFLAQIINVETGELLAGGDEEYREITDGLEKMRTLANALLLASSSLHIQGASSTGASNRYQGMSAVITVTNDRANRVRNAFASVLNAQGLETSGNVPYFRLEVALDVNEVTFPGNNRIFCRIELSANLINIATGQSVNSFGFNERGGHTTYVNAENAAFILVERAIAERYPDVLQQSLSSLSR
ncbi:MAG: hypothetical protein FWB83_01945 [Treponema sp.]|nr:hypothetical protein [Treponema sp.]